MICMQSWKKSWSWVQKVEIKLIDCKVANAQKKNKTVDKSTERNNVFIQSWKENGKNKNIPKITNNWA